MRRRARRTSRPATAAPPSTATTRRPTPTMAAPAPERSGPEAWRSCQGAEDRPSDFAAARRRATRGARAPLGARHDRGDERGEPARFALSAWRPRRGQEEGSNGSAISMMPRCAGRSLRGARTRPLLCAISRHHSQFARRPRSSARAPLHRTRAAGTPLLAAGAASARPLAAPPSPPPPRTAHPSLLPPQIGNYYYGQGHPMKPHRIRMAHNLLLNYGLYRKMEIYRPSSASFEELCKFHSEDYVRFLRTITPDNMGEHTKQMQRFNVGEDCPVFDGLYQFCQASSGGSIGGAVKLNKGHADIAINWAGGLHRQEVRGERLLLHQRHRARDPRAPQAPQARAVHRHRHPPRRRRRGGFLHDGACRRRRRPHPRRAQHTGDGARATPPGHRSRARALSSPRRRTA